MTVVKVQVNRLNGYVVATNHFVTWMLSGAYREPQSLDGDDQSRERRAVVSRVLRENWGGLDENLAQRIMARHTGDGPALCRHEMKDGSATISCSIFLPERRQMLFRNGRPCEDAYSV